METELDYCRKCCEEVEDITKHVCEVEDGDT